jgi:hypothetical protein
MDINGTKYKRPLNWIINEHKVSLIKLNRYIETGAVVYRTKLPYVLKDLFLLISNAESRKLIDMDMAYMYFSQYNYLASQL